MKRFVFQLVLFFLLAARQGLSDTPAVEFPDSTGTNNVEIAEDWTIQFQDIPASTPMYTAWGVWKLLQEMGPGYAQCNCGTKTVAMFILPLNPSGDMGYTDFELKASTNNFYHGTSARDDKESGRLLYWGVSTMLNDSSMGGKPIGYPSKAWDNVWAFSCNGSEDNEMAFLGDARAWVRWRSYTSSRTKHLKFEYPRYVVVLVHPEMLKRPTESGEPADKKWLSSGNVNLVWSYLRVSDGDPEREEEGGSPLWNVCHPVEWFDVKNIPNWVTDKQIQ